MSGCEGIRDLMPLALLGEADPSETASVRAHLEECSSCREESGRLRALLGTLGTVEVPDPGEAYWQGFLPRLRNRLAGGGLGPPAPRLRVVLAWVGSAAVFLMAAVAVGRWDFPEGGNPAMRLGQIARHANPEELRRALEEVFPGAGPTLPAGGAVGAVATADEMERALNGLLPPDDVDIDTMVDDLQPEARRSLVQALDSGRG